MKRGFTLIELLAVIILLGIVTLIVYPNVNATIIDSKKKALEQTINNLKDVAYRYTVENISELNDEEQPILITKLVDDGYIKEIPTNPITKENVTGCIMYKWNNNQYEFRYDEGCEGSGHTINEPNSPTLCTNMVPVIYENNQWIYANTNEKWYDYDNKQWANAVVLNSGVTKSVGQTILESEIAMMYVWIPRYKYVIFNGNNESVPEQEINIEFESGVNSTGTVQCNDAVSGSGSSSEICSDSANGSIINGTSTYTHPAFCFGHRINGICDGSELTGIWVGKFEISTTDTTCNNNQNKTSCNKILPVTIKPNVKSWSYAQISNFFGSIMNISSNYGINFDSHMIRNMEWGAVAYLTQSKYGRCTNGTCSEVEINLSSAFLTGGGNYVSNVNQSTTGNIYGIYDMSGGSWESTMSNMVNSSNQFYFSSAGDGTPPPTRYYDAYTYDSSSDLTHSRGKLGDATKETLQTYGNGFGGWYNGAANFPHESRPWFYRSSFYDDAEEASIFYFSYDKGDALLGDSTRVVGTECCRPR